jgi:hypothetical protein
MKKILINIKEGKDYSLLFINNKILTNPIISKMEDVNFDYYDKITVYTYISNSLKIIVEELKLDPQFKLLNFIKTMMTLMSKNSAHYH